MSGPERDLGRLLAQLQPALDPVEYAFVQRPAGASVPAGVEAFAQVREDEGVTLIVPVDEAKRQGWDPLFRCRRIVLRVHSALDAVGLLAAVTAWLTGSGIPANTISAACHDHLFVPVDLAEEALELLRRRSDEAAGTTAKHPRDIDT